MSVVLVNLQTADAIGGMVTGGVQYTDAAGATNLKATIGGLSNEFYRRAYQNYTYGNTLVTTNLSTSFQAYYMSSYRLESSKAKKLLLTMLAEAQVPVVNDCVLTSVQKSGTKITGLTFNKGTCAVKSTIDASYCGDLLAMAGVSCFIGRESSAQYGESGAGWRIGSQPGTTMSPYVSGSSGPLIPGVVTVSPIPATGDAQPDVQAAGFRLCITNDVANKGTFPAPDSYGATFPVVLAQRYMTANGGGFSSVASVFQLQTILPGDWANKRDANNSAYVSLDWHDPRSTEYITASASRRAEIEYAAKQYVLEMWQFYSTDASVPIACRNSFAAYGPALDEYQNTGNFPPYLYIRKGRTMLTDVVVTQNDITTPTAWADPVAFIYYAFDSHRTKFFNNGGIVTKEGGVPAITDPTLGSKLPLRSMLPKAAEATNLVSAWCLGISDVAWCATRLEPTMGVVGQAAGVLASLVAQRGVTAQSVPYLDVNRVHDLYGMQTYGGTLLLTDGSNSPANQGTVVQAGTWVTNASTDFGTAGYLETNVTSGTNTLTFNPVLRKSGPTRVLIKWNNASGTSRTTAATVTVTGGGVAQGTFTLSQSNGGVNDGDWFDAGIFPMYIGNAAGNNVVVTHGNTTGYTNIIGMKFIPA